MIKPELFDVVELIKAEQFKQPTVTEESRSILFGQTAKTIE